MMRIKVHMYVQDMEFLWSNLRPRGLSTDDDKNTMIIPMSDDDAAGWQHTGDNSWLLMLIGIYAIWTKNWK